MLALIVAFANGNVIGHKGMMPWGRLPVDMQRFKQKRMGFPVVVGARTMDSIGKSLPGSEMIVLTHDPERFRSYDGCIATNDINIVFERAQRTCVYIAGGESVYRQFIPNANVAYITRIDGDFDGDTFFPELCRSEWGLSHSEEAYDGKYRLQFELWIRGYKKTYPFIHDPMCVCRSGTLVSHFD